MSAGITPALAMSPLALAAHAYWRGAQLVLEALDEGNTALAAHYLRAFILKAVEAPTHVQRVATPRVLTLNTALQRALADEVA